MANNNKTGRRCRSYLTAVARGIEPLSGSARLQHAIVSNPMVKGRPVVAIVDSDPATRKSIETLLSSFGFNTELYRSAGEFIEASAATQARCLLMSVELCQMSGIELARYLLKAGVNIPTVYVSTAKNEAAHRAAIDLGCVAFLEKPFGSAQLIEAIVTATSSNPFFER